MKLLYSHLYSRRLQVPIGSGPSKGITRKDAKPGQQSRRLSSHKACACQKPEVIFWSPTSLASTCPLSPLIPSVSSCHSVFRALILTFRNHMLNLISDLLGIPVIFLRSQPVWWGNPRTCGVFLPMLVPVHSQFQSNSTHENKFGHAGPVVLGLGPGQNLCTENKVIKYAVAVIGPCPDLAWPVVPSAVPGPHFLHVGPVTLARHGTSRILNRILSIFFKQNVRTTEQNNHKIIFS
jgi:hypothetical protein